MTNYLKSVLAHEWASEVRAGAGDWQDDYARLPDWPCQCGLVFSERVGLVHAERTGHKQMKIWRRT